MAQNKKVTIEKLALMVQNGFAEVHDEMDKRFAIVDQRFAKMDQKIDNLHGELCDFRTETNQHFNGIEERSARVDGLLVNHEVRIAKLEKKTG